MAHVWTARRTRRAANLLVPALICLTLLAAPAEAAPQQLDSRRGGDVVVTLRNHGKVVIIPGSRAGASPDRARRLSSADLGLEHSEYDYWPYLSSSADVDGNGFEDLVVLAVSRDYYQRGVVQVVPGGPRGLELERSYRVDPGDESGSLGRTMYVADVDGDGFDDVVASYFDSGASGSPPVINESTEPELSVLILWGSDDGLTTGATKFPTPTAHSSPDPLLLAGGNVLGDARREIVVVEPGYPAYGDEPGDSGRMKVCTVDPYRQVTCGAVTATRGGEEAVAVGDFLGGPPADVVLGQSQAYTKGGGTLWVYRSDGGALAPPHQVSQDSAGIPGSTEKGDRFGAALAAADIDGNGKVDLAVGAPGEDSGMGRTWLLYGHRGGLGLGNDSVVSQNTGGVPGRSEPGDAFGAEVSLIDVDGNGRRDLVVGAPAEDSSYGAVTVVRTTNAGRLDPRTKAATIRPEHVGYPYAKRRQWLAFGGTIAR